MHARLSVPNNKHASEMAQWGGKLAVTSSFFFAICGVKPKILPHADSVMFWCCDCPLRKALLAIVFDFNKENINISIEYR